MDYMLFQFSLLRLCEMLGTDCGDAFGRERLCQRLAVRPFLLSVGLFGHFGEEDFVRAVHFCSNR